MKIINLIKEQNIPRIAYSLNQIEKYFNLEYATIQNYISKHGGPPITVKADNGEYYDIFYVDEYKSRPRYLKIVKSKSKKSQKRYRVTIKRSGTFGNSYPDRFAEGTLPELIKYFHYTLEVGKSWQHERGNKKINMNPTSIQSLMTNLYNAKNNAAANGYGGYSYSYELI